MTDTDYGTINGFAILGDNYQGIPLCNNCLDIGTHPITKETHPRGFTCSRCWREVRP